MSIMKRFQKDHDPFYQVHAHRSIRNWKSGQEHSIPMPQKRQNRRSDTRKIFA